MHLPLTLKHCFVNNCLGLSGFAAAGDLCLRLLFDAAYTDVGDLLGAAGKPGGAVGCGLRSAWQRDLPNGDNHHTSKEEVRGNFYFI